MLSTLPAVSKEHHERLMWNVDHLPMLGDRIGTVPLVDLSPEVDEAATFLTVLLLPHMDATERSLYPELERLLQNRHSMTPMRREHAEIRRLVDDLVHIQKDLAAGKLPTGEAMALRRVIFRLYALLKIHLAEEQLYVGMLDHAVSTEVAEALALALEHGGFEHA